MGACVSLNIMWLHADQASFKMTPAQYQDKLDSVAQLVNVLGQTDKVCVPAQRSAASATQQCWLSPPLLTTQQGTSQGLWCEWL